MNLEINSEVYDSVILRQGYIYRDGFVFTRSEKATVFDSLVIRYPQNSHGNPPRLGVSSRTFEDHIQLVNQYQLEKAVIVCNDLSFVAQCPSLKDISVYPDNDFGNNFDYSPLYQMPNLRRLNCRTVYGIKEQYKSSVNYSKMSGIVKISASGVGHIGYELIPTLETLWLSKNKRHKNFSDISCSTHLKDVTLMQCGIQTLNGIEIHRSLQSLSLYHNRSLQDISALRNLGETLRLLVIEGCPKITDFEALSNLVNLEHLQLYGSNILPSLAFLKEMVKLKTFTFTMDVEDGNLSLCKNIPYASCKNRKHFNLKNAQLPKSLPKKFTDTKQS